MNDFTGRVRRDEAKPPEGATRTLVRRGGETGGAGLNVGSHRIPTVYEYRWITPCSADVPSAREALIQVLTILGMSVHTGSALPVQP
jgi:hypothetical protein